MALPTYTAVVISCSCEQQTVSAAYLYNGDHTDSGNRVHTISYGRIINHDNADRNELLSDIEAGGIDIYLKDHDADTDYWALADVPPELQRILSAFSFHPSKGWQYPYHVTQQADITEDPDTGADVLESPIGFLPVKIEPAGDTFDQGLGDWDAALVVSGGEDYLQLQLPIPVSADLDTTAKLNAHGPVVAIIAWLESLRDTTESGSTAVGDNFLVGSSFQNRTFELTQETGDTDDLSLTYSSHSQVLIDADFRYIRVGINFLADSAGADINISAIQAILAAASESIDSEGLLVDPPHGNRLIEHRASRIVGAGGRHIDLLGPGLRYQGVEEDGATPYKMYIGAGHGRSAQYLDLSTVTNSGTTYGRLPQNPDITHVHFGHNESADGQIVVEDPISFGLPNNGVRSFAVHNVHANHACELVDANYDNLITLQPNQFCHVQLLVEANGDREIIIPDPPARRLAHTATEQGFLNGAGHWNRNMDRDIWLLPIGNTISVSYIDDDAFEFGTETLTDNSDWVGYTDWHLTHSVQMKMGGIMTSEIVLVLEVNDTANGSMQESNFLRPFIVGSDDLPVALPRVNGPLLSGGGDSWAYEIVHTGFVEANDIFLAGFFKLTSDTLLPLGITIKELLVALTLHPTIRVELT